MQTVKIETVVNGKVVKTEEYQIETKIWHILKFKKPFCADWASPYQRVYSKQHCGVVEFDPRGQKGVFVHSGHDADSHVIPMEFLEYVGEYVKVVKVFANNKDAYGKNQSVIESALNDEYMSEFGQVSGTPARAWNGEKFRGVDCG